MVRAPSPRTRASTCVIAPLLFLSAAFSLALSQPSDKLHKQTVTATENSYAPFLINNVFNFYGNNGDGSYNAFSLNAEGFEFPKGTGKQTTFEDGLFWGGYHKGRLLPKVGGSDYRHAIQAGNILSPGSATSDPLAADPSLPGYRLYRVRPDVNPATPYNALMEMALSREEVSLIGRYTPTSARQIYEQYLRDWDEWPADQGAPFRDINGNGTYEPTIDIPGYPEADQTLFYVANDCNAARVANLTGSPIIGVEIERTIWGYKRGGTLGNTIFIGTKIINKSGAPIDSMYIAQWFDPDVGGAADDLIGCDSLRNLGYAYNGTSIDEVYGSTPPAVGFALLRGPIVPGAPSDTAYAQDRSRPGYRNIGLTAFVGFMGGWRIFNDPTSGPGGDVQRYRFMKGTRGDSGLPYIDPTTNQETKFIFPGDPVNAQGWVDGLPYWPGDRRCMMSSGPFTMVNGDTQEVVIAHVSAQGADRLSSISRLKYDVDQLHTFFRDPAHALPPVLTTNVTYPTATDASIHLTADFKRTHPQSVTATLTNGEGLLVADFALFDDGVHADGSPGDGIFGSTFTLPRRSSPISLSLRATDASGINRSWNSLEEGLVTAGHALIKEAKLYSDNINNDGAVNPGENIRYGFTISNETLFPLLDLQVESGDTHVRIPSIAPATDFSFHYDDRDPTSYCTLTLPANFKGDEDVIPVLLTDINRNTWSGNVTLPVQPLPFTPTYSSLMERGGTASGNFDLLVVDPAQIKGHRYVLRGSDSAGGGSGRGFTLQDSTDGRTLLFEQPLPDSLGHDIPVTDGFKILRGTIDLRIGTMKWLTQLDGTTPWTSYGVSNVLELEGFGGTIGNAFDHWPSGGVGYKDQHSVRLVFPSADSPSSDSAVSYAYRYLQHANAPPARPEFASYIVNPATGFAYQDFTRGLPFAAYDVTTVPPRRLAVGFLENNVPLGFVDANYNPPPAAAPYDNGSVDGPREWFFIFDKPYSETPDPTLQVDITANHVPLMWLGYPLGTGAMRTGAILTIVPYRAPGPADWWTFTLDRTDYLPSTHALFQNFPNPFNSGTTIRYTLPEPATVTLKIYNVLGQEVRTLFSGYQYPGEVSVSWDGTNNSGHSVVSGVYFYRLSAKNISDPQGVYVKVNKMVVLR